MSVDSRHSRPVSLWVPIIVFLSLSGCGKSFYKTQLTAEQKNQICDYSVPWDRQECLAQADEQIEWCKEALGQEDDCWNTLLGDYSRYRKDLLVTDAQYFEILHDPVKISPLLEKIKRKHPRL
ncbi:MAG: hypothetical protein RLZZ627_1927 [Pseudomonadota bacterium]|jgi:hypothetical protein